MFVANNVYPTLVYHKSFGVPGYKVMQSEEEHREFYNKINVDQPKVKKTQKYTIEE